MYGLGQDSVVMLIRDQKIRRSRQMDKVKRALDAG